MKTTNSSSRITISQDSNQILSCKVYKELNYILSMSNEEILELISGLDYKGTISRFQAQYNIQEINPYLQDILQNPEDLISLSQHHKR